MGKTVGICGTHAPRPHNEFICHATGEKRQNILNELKLLLDKIDDRPCLLPEPKKNSSRNRPLMKFPGYVDPHHPAYQPPKQPLITMVSVEETRNTCEPGRSADDPPKIYYRNIPLQANIHAPMGQRNRFNSQELRGGVMIKLCECERRNGLQDQCPRRECQGQPECMASNPGPCCRPALAQQPQPPKIPDTSKELCVVRGGVMKCCCCHEC